MPEKWVVNVRRVGQGMSALKYLSRYLYRGVISEKNIIANENGRVTFKYKNSDSGKTETRTLTGEDFLALILKHVLPRGFRRVRDYGFLHGNAKALLKLIQLILHITVESTILRKRAEFICPKCKATMVIKIITHAARSG